MIRFTRLDALTYLVTSLAMLSTLSYIAYTLGSDILAASKLTTATAVMFGIGIWCTIGVVSMFAVRNKHEFVHWCTGTIMIIVIIASLYTPPVAVTSVIFLPVTLVLLGKAISSK